MKNYNNFEKGEKDKNFLTLIITAVVIITVGVSLACLIAWSSGVNNIRYPVFEWVSSDGVHYWICDRDLTPRYNSDGEMMVDP